MGEGGLMKHGELLIHLMVLEPEETVETRAIKLNNAIRAVVNLHVEVAGCCGVCRDDWWATEYPCRTIELIEKELA